MMKRSCSEDMEERIFFLGHVHLSLTRSEVLRVKSTGVVLLEFGGRSQAQMSTSIVQVGQEFEALRKLVKVFWPSKFFSRLAVVGVKIFEVGSMQAELCYCFFYKLQFFGLKLINVSACRPQFSLPTVNLADLFSDRDQVREDRPIGILGHLILYTLCYCAWCGRIYF